MERGTIEVRYQIPIGIKRDSKKHLGSTTYLNRSLKLLPAPPSLFSLSLVGLRKPVSSRVLLKSLLGLLPSSSELEYIFATLSYS